MFRPKTPTTAIRQTIDNSDMGSNGEIERRKEESLSVEKALRTCCMTYLSRKLSLIPKF